MTDINIQMIKPSVICPAKVAGYKLFAVVVPFLSALHFKTYK